MFFVIVGIIGIFVPGLPTTPFLLLSAYLFLRSSEKLFNWLTKHKLLGAYIENYRQRRALTLRSKTISIIMIWAMISLSIISLDHLHAEIIIACLGVIGTVVMLRIPTYKEN